jgi:RNA polymerase sigma factor (sigma-70 family)
MTRQEDEALARAIASGDELAASRFDQTFRARIEAIARKRKVPGSDCADVAQDVLADALRQLRQGKFRGEASLATWLHPILHGGIANYFRRRHGPKTVSLDDLADVDNRSLVATGDRHAVLAVQQALSQLSPADQFLLVLYYQQGWTLEEIGPMVGLRKSAVAEHVKAACERFRVALRNGGKNPDSPRLKD